MEKIWTAPRNTDWRCSSQPASTESGYSRAMSSLCTSESSNGGNLGQQCRWTVYLTDWRKKCGRTQRRSGFGVLLPFIHDFVLLCSGV